MVEFAKLFFRKHLALNRIREQEGHEFDVSCYDTNAAALHAVRELAARHDTPLRSHYAVAPGEIDLGPSNRSGARLRPL